jgi:two-component system response regulator PilR (NtrC family)
VPALRERGDDILLLAGRILEKLGSSADALDENARSALLNYSYPGNVRELENLLERAVTLCSNGKIRERDLSLRNSSTKENSHASAGPTDLGNQIESVQRQAIVEALEKARYNKTAAARLLGLTFRQLRYRIKKLGIE